MDRNSLKLESSVQVNATKVEIYVSELKKTDLIIPSHPKLLNSYLWTDHHKTKSHTILQIWRTVTPQEESRAYKLRYSLILMCHDQMKSLVKNKVCDICSVQAPVCRRALILVPEVYSLLFLSPVV